MYQSDDYNTALKIAMRFPEHLRCVKEVVSVLNVSFPIWQTLYLAEITSAVVNGQQRADTQHQPDTIVQEQKTTRSM